MAVWKVADAQSGATIYWVGVERYWGAFFEFVDDQLTDDVFYHNMWKQNIAPDCRGKLIRRHGARVTAREYGRLRR